MPRLRETTTATMYVLSPSAPVAVAVHAWQNTSCLLLIIHNAQLQNQHYLSCHGDVNFMTIVIFQRQGCHALQIRSKADSFYQGQNFPRFFQLFQMIGSLRKYWFFMFLCLRKVSFKCYKLASFLGSHAEGKESSNGLHSLIQVTSKRQIVSFMCHSIQLE